MDAKQAIVRAKTYFSELFEEEGIANLGLEEVRREESNNDWLITLGFSWQRDAYAGITTVSGRPVNVPRFYKTVSLKDSDGSLISITNRHVGEQ